MSSLPMFSFTNRTLFDIPSTWNRTRFEATRSKYRQAQKLIQISINGNNIREGIYRLLIYLFF